MLILFLGASLSAVLGIDLRDSSIKAAVGVHHTQSFPNFFCHDPNSDAVRLGEAVSDFSGSSTSLCLRNYFLTTPFGPDKNGMVFAKL
jgi:hypothetical protein